MRGSIARQRTAAICAEQAKPCTLVRSIHLTIRMFLRQEFGSDRSVLSYRDGV